PFQRITKRYGTIPRNNRILPALLGASWLRGYRILPPALLAVCLALTCVTQVAESAERAAKKDRQKENRAATPGVATGVRRSHESVDAYYGGTKLDTTKEFRNELGQTVYSVAASHFD